ncbi:hypothetical protein PR003_g1516 [Phytophthora rubi]|uniref:REJ domain-containing protein n=1 Tax=Phytophthora rubi TaxID=129364 RepID=A0A6A3P1L5_9STRA|nr:hypothetical protein PR002_g988 [Phytophthora rubi]KAE9051803.1 hypothetical protein PR001_g1100 [Phytophthora rubi]KAE9358012.1 hypothetical protein PR003_g1516 [Phytophthora rubi]
MTWYGVSLAAYTLSASTILPSPSPSPSFSSSSSSPSSSPPSSLPPLQQHWVSLAAYAL